MPFCTSIPKNLPDFIVEVTSKKFKKSSKTVIDSTCLSDNWETCKVYRIPSCVAGTYLLYNLHKNPHYMLHNSKRDWFEKQAKVKGIHIYDVNQPATEIPNELYHFTYNSAPYIQHVLPFEKDFCLEEIITKLKSEKDINKRGNWANSHGWQGQNLIFQHVMTVPHHTTLSELDKQIFRLMTNIVYSIYSDKLQVVPYTGHKNRMYTFAQQLIAETSSYSNRPDNIFESVTYAMTYCDTKNENNTELLKPHIDSQNCRDCSYNVVFSVYFYYRPTTDPSNLIRVVFVGYSRKSIGDYYRRLKRRTLFKEHLLKYIKIMENTDSERLNLSLQNAMQNSTNNQSDHIMSTKLPFMDKCAYYSLYASVLYDLIYSKPDGKTWTMSKVLELVLPVAWLTTGSNYYRIVKQWQTNGIPKGHLTVEVVKSLVLIGGSMSGGDGPRMQPFVNRPIPMIRVNQGLQVIFDIVKKANANIEKCYLEEFVSEMQKKVYGVGWLGAQHLLSILCLLRIIKNIEYIRQAMPMKNTLTEAKIHANYNINHKTACALYKEIAKEKFGGCTRIVENLGCEFFRDIKEPHGDWDDDDYIESVNKRCAGSSIQHPDTFYSTQSLFIEKNGNIDRLYYDTNGNVCKETMNAKHFGIYHLEEKDSPTRWVEENNATNMFIPIKPMQTNPPLAKKPKVQIHPTVFHYEYCVEQKKIIEIFHDFHNVMPVFEDLLEPEFGKKINGVFYEIDLLWLLNDLVGKNLGKKRKSKHQSRKKMHCISKYIRDKDRKIQIYTYSWKTVGCSMSILKLSSDKMYPNGFVEYSKLESNKSQGIKSDSMRAFYESPEAAKMALMIKILTTTKNCNIATHPNFQKRFSSNKLQMIFIFQKSSDKDAINTNNFFGVLSKSGSKKYKLHVPSHTRSHLFQPWHTFPICNGK